MKKIRLGGTGLEVSAIGLGCMRLAELDTAGTKELLSSALEEGINFFDHADIYGGGRSEELFAEAFGMLPFSREDIILQSKCGIRRGFYDFSKEHIIASAEASLKRLKTDYLDILLLHRPDTLMEPEEVAEAFEQLKRDGKVRCFGVSNHDPMQIELLKRYLGQELIVNQMQLSLAHCAIIDEGLNVNIGNDLSPVRTGGLLEYCRLNNITIQAWSPFQYGFFEGSFIGSEKYPELNMVLDAIAAENRVTNSAIAIAWILRHPARIQPIVGTTNAKRLSDIAKASDVFMTREEWYRLYLAAGKKLP